MSSHVCLSITNVFDLSLKVTSRTVMSINRLLSICVKRKHLKMSKSLTLRKTSHHVISCLPLTWLLDDGCWVGRKVQEGRPVREERLTTSCFIPSPTILGWKMGAQFSAGSVMLGCPYRFPDCTHANQTSLLIIINLHLSHQPHFFSFSPLLAPPFL